MCIQSCPTQTVNTTPYWIGGIKCHTSFALFRNLPAQGNFFGTFATKHPGLVFARRFDVAFAARQVEELRCVARNQALDGTVIGKPTFVGFAAQLTKISDDSAPGSDGLYGKAWKSAPPG